jgi:NADP-dependent 3-hydroxy acid dehydrogenase YdfG
MQPEEDVRSVRMLDPEDVAETVLFAVSRPRHVAISEIRINPSHLDRPLPQFGSSEPRGGSR